MFYGEIRLVNIIDWFADFRFPIYERERERGTNGTLVGRKFVFLPMRLTLRKRSLSFSFSLSGERFRLVLTFTVYGVHIHTRLGRV